MTIKLSLQLAATAALLALAACNGGSSSTEAGDANASAENATAAATPLPPMIKSNKIYRCKDNSVLYVDYMNDDLTANLRTEKDGTPTVLKAEKVGDPFVSGETSLSGSGDSVTIALPGKGSQSCKH